MCGGNKYGNFTENIGSGFVGSSPGDGATILFNGWHWCGENKYGHLTAENIGSYFVGSSPEDGSRILFNGKTWYEAEMKINERHGDLIHWMDKSFVGTVGWKERDKGKKKRLKRRVGG
ncbi:hypothetical protein RRG08_057918 [Elysia crispata]|uniref:Uncharacterized protein n=1 Tax=Elysia crispata TaxID=231223 RepID=A0AAE1DSE6_9GAST|nr:hypothetical protein RRG08_057918 [Elysia crispata]